MLCKCLLFDILCKSMMSIMLRCDIVTIFIIRHIDENLIYYIQIVNLEVNSILGHKLIKNNKYHLSIGCKNVVKVI